MNEELGLETKFIKLFKYLHNSNIGNAYKIIYSATTNNKITIDKFEVDSVRWINIPELQNEIKNNPKKFTPQFIEAMAIYCKLKVTEK